MTIEARAIRMLNAMDIPVWLARAPVARGADELQNEAVASPETGSIDDRFTEVAAGEPRRRLARIRLEAGSGRWLLVIDDADRARHADLIEDIRAALGTDDCRFGTWSDSAEAGVAREDWKAHGIDQALVFGGDAGPGFVQAGEITRLAASGDARRALWRQIKPLLKP